MKTLRKLIVPFAIINIILIATNFVIPHEIRESSIWQYFFIISVSLSAFLCLFYFVKQDITKISIFGLVVAIFSLFSLILNSSQSYDVGTEEKTEIVIQSTEKEVSGSKTSDTDLKENDPQVVPVPSSTYEPYIDDDTAEQKGEGSMDLSQEDDFNVQDTEEVSSDSLSE